MRRIILLSILGLLAFTGFGQESTRKNALSIDLGPGYLARQDLIFTPLIHNDLSLLNIGFHYTRNAKLFQKASLRYAGFSPMVAEPFEFTIHGDTNTAYPHSFSLIDLDYQLGKSIKETPHAVTTVGGLFSTDIQALNYAYGRIGSFGYYAAFGLGVFGKYGRTINEKSQVSATLQFPLVAWLARSPYLVNDDAFIENISSHDGFKTLMAFIGDGQLVTWNKMQTLDLALKYEYQLSERWGLGAAYLFEFIHVPQPRNLLSFRHSLNLSTHFRF